MGFHPAVNEEAKGFWGGYYVGLGWLLFGACGLINIFIVAYVLLHSPDTSVAGVWLALQDWYFRENMLYFGVMLGLIGVGLASFLVGFFVNKKNK